MAGRGGCEFSEFQKLTWPYTILSLLRAKKGVEPTRHGRAVLVLMHSALQAEGSRRVSEVIH